MTDPAAHDSPSERDVADDIASHDITCVVCGREMRVRTNALGRLCTVPCGCAPERSPVAVTASEDDNFDCFVGDADDSNHLRNLLAIIHGDGGHHTEAVGIARSCRDAAAKWYRLDNDAENIAIAKTVPRLMDETMAALHREERDALRARVAELERVVKGRTTPPTDAEIDAHDGPWWIVLDHSAGFAVRFVDGDSAKRLAALQRNRGSSHVWRAFHASTGELVPTVAPKPMGFAEALDAVRRGPVGLSGCARCGDTATAACDACGVHLCSVCGATPTCDDGDPCALRRYPHPDKEPTLCVDIETWGRVLG